MARPCLTYKNSAVFLHTSLHRGVKHSKPLGLTTFLFSYEEVTDKRLLNKGKVFGFFDYRPPNTPT